MSPNRTVGINYGIEYTLHTHTKKNRVLFSRMPSLFGPKKKPDFCYQHKLRGGMSNRLGSQRVTEEGGPPPLGVCYFSSTTFHT